MEDGLHVGVIIDGNRRWAKARGKHPWEGHEAGAEALKGVIRCLEGTDVKELTVYTFSMQNFKRDETEKKKLFDLMAKYFEALKDEPAIIENQIRVSFLGRTHLLPEDLQEAIGSIENNTKNYDNYRLNFCLAYGGREEIIDAIKKIVAIRDIGPEDITEELVKRNLYSASEPDFIIRTSGEHRTSNFLIWQGSYSEWFFLDKMWPDFNREDLLDCISKFRETRQRRFGK